MSSFVPYIKKLVSQFNLDLSDKVIITELATNAYFDAALIPLFAGAKKVIYVDNNVSEEDRAHSKKKTHRNSRIECNNFRDFNKRI